ncbi:DUF2478 domain-containing protein [Xanthobacter pseudotagetidis]|uniref:DUF2478 domain-containing protein n=1 Tax=Xanthobacter pseudotagetidis TaxID=3119911 RepID=UPI00372B29BD
MSTPAAPRARAPSMGTGAAAAPLFDAESDVAALVYGRDEAPDAILTAFARDLGARGVDAVGVVQGRRTARGRASGLMLIPEGRELEVTDCGARHAPDWRDTLGRIEGSLLEAAHRRPDLLILNRFGAAERAGGGLIAVICAAVERDVPVLLPVPAAHFPDWLRFTEGLCVRLACSRASLDAWWSGLRPPSARAPSRRFCESGK